MGSALLKDYSRYDNKKLNFRIIFSVIAIFVILDLIIMLFPSYMPIRYNSPDFALKSTNLSEDGSIIYLNYTIKELEIRALSKCLIFAFNFSFVCNSKTEKDRIIVFVPKEIYPILYDYSNSSVSYFYLRINITLDKGFAIWNNSYAVEFKPLLVKTGNLSVEVYNPNFIDFNLTNVRILYYPSTNQLPIIKELGEIKVKARETVKINADAFNGIIYISFQYNYKFAKNGVVYESRQVYP
jgi:hypothetical protein